MTTKIARINEIAKRNPKEVFTSIYHLINYDLLLECYKELDGNKATGLDKITKDEYFINLEENLNSIVHRLKTMSYKPSPARRVNIPKANGKVRGLAISNFEDKIVQMAIKKIVEAIFEPKLPNNMFGFRPNKSCHDALKKITNDIQSKHTNHILDADIKGYFDNINHNKLMRCLEMHIRDRNLLRLIKRFLKAGIMEGTNYIKGEVGTPQGSILSPILANIYMYYMLVKWTENIETEMAGFISLTNYADDFIVCFQYKEDANRYLKKLRSRLNQCSLELSEEKTRLIEFGRYAITNAKKHNTKPETFDFLGFTHYCSTAKSGFFRVKRKTSRKKFNQKVQEFEKWIKQNRNKPLKEIMITVRKKLIGHYNYYGVTDNIKMLEKYSFYVTKLIFKWLNRRSQRKSYTVESFNQMLKHYGIPEPSIKINIYAKS